jgi:hypothetical protein
MLRGDVTTFVLVPRIVDAVAPMPVVAAGGVADGRGVGRCSGVGGAGRHDRHPAHRNAALTDNASRPVLCRGRSVRASLPQCFALGNK